MSAASPRYVERFGGEVRRLAGNLGRQFPEAPARQSSDPEALINRTLYQGLGATRASPGR